MIKVQNILFNNGKSGDFPYVMTSHNLKYTRATLDVWTRTLSESTTFEGNKNGAGFQKYNEGTDET